MAVQRLCSLGPIRVRAAVARSGQAMEVIVMKSTKLIFALAAPLALAACDSAAENNAEAAGDAVQEQAEIQADAMENQADATRAADAGLNSEGTEMRADAIEDRADATREAADARADAMEANAEARQATKN